MAKKVTVVGAGFYGSTTALRLAEYNIFDTVVLTDILEGKPEGLALDMNQSRSIEGFETKIIGATTTADGAGYEATANSDVVVITAGLPRKPGMTREELIGVNAGIVKSVVENIRNAESIKECIFLYILPLFNIDNLFFNFGSISSFKYSLHAQLSGMMEIRFCKIKGISIRRKPLSS